MARFVLVCLVVLLEILLVQAMANRSEPYPYPEVESHVAVSRVADPPVSWDGEGESGVAEGPEIRRLGKHHSSDKSVAGGGVIIGGLVTAIFAAVYCYIRVTRTRDGDKL